MDALNPARNRGSVAHPNQQLLDADEAMLFINSARTVLQFLNAKLAPPRPESGEFDDHDIPF